MAANNSNIHIAHIMQKNDLGEMWYNEEIGFPFVAKNEDGELIYSWNTSIIRVATNEDNLYYGAGDNSFDGKNIALWEILGFDGLNIPQGLAIYPPTATTQDNDNYESGVVAFWYKDDRDNWYQFEEGDEFILGDYVQEGQYITGLWLDQFKKTHEDVTEYPPITVGEHFWRLQISTEETPVE